MPNSATASRHLRTRGRRNIGLLGLRGYLIVVALLVAVRFVQLVGGSRH